MFFSILVFIGIITIPIWGIVLCINLAMIIEKIMYKKVYTKNLFWFTFSVVFILIIFTIILTIPAPPYDLQSR